LIQSWVRPFDSIVPKPVFLQLVAGITVLRHPLYNLLIVRSSETLMSAVSFPIMTRTGLLEQCRQRLLAYCISLNLFLGSELTQSRKGLEMCCLSFLLLGRCWVHSRGESSIALIKDPQGNPHPERVKEEKIYPSMYMSVSLPWYLCVSSATI
jgi:hypothetical protein